MVSKTTGSFVPFSTERAAEVVEKHRAERGPLMPILHELQDIFGYIDPDALDVLASALNVSKADVYGVVTFYKDFRDKPPGNSVVSICRGEACQSMGAEKLARHAREHLEVDLGETTPDGAVTLRQVFCLGNCALSPAVMVDGRLQGRVDEARFDEIVAGLRAKARS
ncbi:MAG: formate dehydrogenase subunit gamma [Acidimicrobiales bacterium]|jgi:formate dehydrogenase subunit gamma